MNSPPPPEPTPSSPNNPTAEVQLEQQRQAYEQLLHAVSHDLRAPLRHITSFAPLLRESVQALQAGDMQAAEEAEQFLSTMEHAARRMGRMMEALLQVSRAARAVLHWQPVDMVALAREEGLRVQALRGLSDAPVQWQWPSAAVWVHADVPLLRQLWAVLLDNALKFSEGSQPAARIVITTEMLDTGGLRCSVQDNGVGFDGTRAHQLGALFQRLHRESEFDGVGAGVALAHTIAQRHGARLQLEAQPAQGCCAMLDWYALATA